MARFSTSTAIYFAAATFLGAVILPASLDFAASRLSDPASSSLAQAGSSGTAPSSHARSTRAKPASVQRRAERTDRVEARIKQLHAQLKITPDQEDQWNAFAKVMRENAKTMQSQAEERQQNLGTMSAMDDLNSYEQITETHAEALKKLIPEFQTLYDAMSPDQQRNADAVFRRYSREMAARETMPTSGHATPKARSQTQ